MGSHFYADIDFTIVYNICVRLIKSDIFAELYTVLEGLEEELEKREHDNNE
jgi:hypothetical protein